MAACQGATTSRGKFDSSQKMSGAQQKANAATGKAPPAQGCRAGAVAGVHQAAPTYLHGSFCAWHPRRRLGKLSPLAHNATQVLVRSVARVDVVLPPSWQSSWLGC